MGYRYKPTDEEMGQVLSLRNPTYDGPMGVFEGYGEQDERYSADPWEAPLPQGLHQGSSDQAHKACLLAQNEEERRRDDEDACRAMDDVPSDSIVDWADYDDDPRMNRAFPGFYEGKSVVEEAGQLEPGIIITAYNCFFDPSKGIRYRVEGHPHEHGDYRSSLWVLVTSLATGSMTELCLPDYGIMEFNKAPYNWHRLVIEDEH